MVSGNVIKDCSTMIAAFNLFIKYYGNENYFNDKISQVITGNTFMNIRSSQNWQTALIRTSGIANVSNNNWVFDIFLKISLKLQINDQKNLNKRISILALKMPAIFFNIFFTYPRNMYTSKVTAKTPTAKNI